MEEKIQKKSKEIKINLYRDKLKINLYQAHQFNNIKKDTLTMIFLERQDNFCITFFLYL